MLLCTLVDIAPYGRICVDVCYVNTIIPLYVIRKLAGSLGLLVFFKYISVLLYVFSCF